MKYYIDTSSLVKIYHREQGTDIILNIYKSQDEIIISELSKIEFISTIYRKYREHEIFLDTVHAVIKKFGDDVEHRFELLRFSSPIVDEAQSLLYCFAEKYALKTQDSFQFAFFKSYCEVETIFVCSDIKLTKLVEREGFKVLSTQT
ncbi:MAG: type II toxin-antitoxin system VapC family toxin [Desulfobacterales bacterium]|nr:type II toxin-antitoxin system VapC family toxin [Desulfobacterales bacterium]MBF0395383.1 type II toxin-antitoxin system VapC family toxin [Desulfobacterales bacterium]